MTEYIMQAYRVAEEIKDSLKYKRLKTLEKEIEETYKEHLKEFNQIKEVYYQILEDGGKYHPDYIKTVKTLGLAKQVLYEKQEVKEYFKLEQEIQSELNIFVKSITEIVSSHIKKPNEMGLLKEKGGGCHAN